MIDNKCQSKTLYSHEQQDRYSQSLVETERQIRTTMMSKHQQQQQKASYVVLGSRDQICTKSRYHPVLGQINENLMCKIRQFQDPTVPKEQWRKQVVLSKFEICGFNDTNTTKPPTQTMALGANSFQIMVKTLNTYVNAVYKCIDRYTDKYISASSILTPEELAIDIEKYLQESGLVVNESIPLKLEDIEKNKQLHLPNVIPNKMGEALNTEKFWTCISTFSHPQTQERTTDEMYARLVRTSTWAEEGTDCMKWWGVNCMLHRWSLDQKELTSPTSLLTLSPKETLCLLSYLTEPYTKDQATNCLLREYPDLLNDVITRCIMRPTSANQSSILSPEDDDDNTMYVSNVQFHDPPADIVLTDFGKAVKMALNKEHSAPAEAITPPPKRHMIEAAPPKRGEPPNAPLRLTTAAKKGPQRSRKRAPIIYELVREDDDVSLASAYPKDSSSTPNKAQRGAGQKSSSSSSSLGNNNTWHSAAKKTKKAPNPPSSSNSIEVVWDGDSTPPTPPPPPPPPLSDDDDYDYDGADSSSCIEPSQMDKINA